VIFIVTAADALRPLSKQLTGVRRGNHIGGGELSFEDIGAVIAIPEKTGNGGSHYITIPKNIASVALQYLMDSLGIATFPILQILQVFIQARVTDL
jgi:hypothetical protein